MNYKLYILKTDLREYGFSYVLKRVISYLLRPLTNLMQRSIFLVNLWYGVLPNLREKLPFGKSNPKFIKFPQTDLVKRVREFWYGNIPGNFDLDGEKISRKDIFTHGGPNPKFTCPICQKSEWLSRIKQKNLFQPHTCPQVKECEELCKKQGDELWIHYHQNFHFIFGSNPNLPAPKGLYLRAIPNEKYFNLKPCCDLGPLVNSRRFAFACQIDMVQKPININWSNYDFLFIDISGSNQKFPRPNIPIILYGHDFWKNKNYFQWVINWLKPDIFLTSYPTQWKENFKFPSKTKIVFYPLFPSLFFTRTNLTEKKLDLLVIGTVANPIYRSRIELSKQISQLASKYRIEFSHWVGALRDRWRGPTEYTDLFSHQTVRYLNKWFEYLGSAKYVIFGRIGDPKKQFLVFKYYETLGSGAIPIFPEVPDLKLLGVRPFEHYIPLSEIENNNERLAYFLDHYEDFKHIAQNAVDWYKKVSDKMIFNDFEDLIREITNYKYPKKLI